MKTFRTILRSSMRICFECEYLSLCGEGFAPGVYRYAEKGLLQGFAPGLGLA
jgi:hypothetical protein